MSLLHAWPIAAGLFAAILPVVIHFLTRPKPVSVPLPTIRFVREAVQQRRARQTLRDLLILLLRSSAVLLLALALARPFFGQRSRAAAGGDKETSRVVLLDVSQSMAASERGIQAFERARARAAAALAYRPGLRANLLEAGAAPRAAFEQCSTNFSALRERVNKAEARPERLNVRAALAYAAELLTDGGREAGQRELVVVSDFQRSNWAAADFSVLPADTTIELESIAPESVPANVAILDVNFPGRVISGRSARCQIDVGNFSSSPRSVNLELSIGESTLRLAGVCPPGETTALHGEVIFRTPGWLTGHCRLIGNEDALVADDLRHLALEVRSVPTCALLTRQAPTAGPASSYYLERALSPVPTGEESQSLVVRRFDPGQLEDDAIAASDLIVLDHPGKLSATATRRLAALLRRGRAVLYLASEPVDATNLRQLAEAVGADLQMPVEFSPAPAGSPRNDLFLADVKRDRRPFSVFGDGLVEQISSLRFGGGLATRHIDGAATDDIAAIFSDRSAALVVTACGAGALAVLNVDLNHSNLPASTAFVPLVGELVEQLLDRRSQNPALLCGEASVVYLPPEAGAPAGLQLGGPNAEATEMAEIAEDRIGTVVRMRTAGAPGLWELRRGDKLVFASATTIAREESDLRPLEASILTSRLAGGRDVEYRAATDTPTNIDTAWSWIAAACVACLIAEFLALRVYRT